MCELLGLTFNKPISPGLSFRGFRHRAQRNRHGWGLAAIGSRKAHITKEPIRADDSDLSRSLRDHPTLVAPLFIGHVRAASCGDVNLDNTHPFTRRLDYYHDTGGYNGLRYTRRRARFSKVSLRDEDWEADLREEKAPDQRGFVIASRRLTDDEDWTEFRRGTLMVFERGDVAYGGM